VFDSGENSQIDLGFITRAGDCRDYHMLLVPECDALGKVGSVLGYRARHHRDEGFAQRQMEQFVANLPGFAYSFRLVARRTRQLPLRQPRH
jgi:hypothetical protein